MYWTKRYISTYAECHVCGVCCLLASCTSMPLLCWLLMLLADKAFCWKLVLLHCRNCTAENDYEHVVPEAMCIPAGLHSSWHNSLYIGKHTCLCVGSQNIVHCESQPVESQPLHLESQPFYTIAMGLLLAISYHVMSCNKQAPSNSIASSAALQLDRDHACPLAAGLYPQQGPCC